MRKVLKWHVACFCIFILTSCSLHVKETRALDESITVHDPLFSKMLSLVEDLDLKAEGKFASGTYQIKTESGKTIGVKVPENVRFKLALHLTLHGSNTIDTKDAEGNFETTNPIFVANLPVAASISFDHGKVSADMDLIHTIAATIVNMLQGTGTANAADGGAINLIEELHIEQATLHLKKSASVQLNGFNLNLASGRLILEKASFQNKSDFRGNWRVVATAKEAGRLEQQNSIGISTKDAFVELAFSVERKDDLITLHLISESRNAIEIKSLKLSKHGSYLAAQDAFITVKAVDFKHKMNAGDDSLDSSARLLLQNCDVLAKSPTSQLSAKLAVKQNAMIDLDVEGSKELLELNIPQAQANDVHVEITRPGGQVSIGLKQASIGSFLFRKDGQVAATLSQGEVAPTNINWTSGKTHVDVVMQQGAKIKIDRPISIDSTTSASIRGKDLPFDLRSGRVAIIKGKDKLTLENISGKIIVSIEDSDINLKGTVAAKAGLQPFLGVPDLMVSVEKVSLETRDKHLHAHFAGCHLKIPQKEMSSAISNSLADGKTFSLQKPVFDKMKWRYRKMILNSVTVKQPNLLSVTFDKKNHCTVSCKANVTAAGTVERFNMKINPLSKEDRGWIQKPWSGQGTVSGKAGCMLSFVPGASLRDCELKYDVDARFAIPEDLTVDWSKVDEGLLGKSEHALITKVIKHSGVFTPDEGIKVERNGSIKPVKRRDDRLKLVRISNVSILPSKQDLDLSFTADAAM